MFEITICDLKAALGRTVLAQYYEQRLDSEFPVIRGQFVERCPPLFIRPALVLHQGLEPHPAMGTHPPVTALPRAISSRIRNSSPTAGAGSFTMACLALPSRIRSFIGVPFFRRDASRRLVSLAIPETPRQV